MKARTLAALKKSIKHWEGNVAAKTPEEASAGPKKCALCRLFIKKEDYSGRLCTGCPVRDRTGLMHCAGTPYERAEDNFYDWQAGVIYRRPFTAAAKAELKFLKSLLPKETK